MRRSELENNSPEFMKDVLERAPYLVISTRTDGFPYAFPVSQFMHGDRIFFHCAMEGRKLDLIRKDPRIGFTAVADPEVSGTTMLFRSVIGTGTAEIITDPELKAAALVSLAKHYKAPCRFPVAPEKFAATCIVAITIESMTGKWKRRI